MNRLCFACLVLICLTLGSAGAEPRPEDTLLSAARQVLPRDLSTNALVRALPNGVWNSNRTALAISLPRPAPQATVLLVFLRQTNGSFLATDASGVEGGNFGKLGTAGRRGYERFETTPMRWLPREDGFFQVLVRTRAWQKGKRYTVAEPLVIRPDGTVLYR